MTGLSNDALRCLESVVSQLKNNYHYRMYCRMDEAEPDNEDGGPGSGNWGHLGRKGQWGGSAPGGGKQNRHVEPHSGKYTSWSKQRDRVAKKHDTSRAELTNLPQGSIIKRKDGSAYQKKGDDWYLCVKSNKGGEEAPSQMDADDLDGETVRIAVPKQANPNIQKDVYNFESIQDDMDNAPRYRTARQADAALHNSAQQVADGLTKAQKIAIKGYVNGSSAAINDPLRQGKATGPITKAVNDMTNAVAQSKLPAMWVQRGVDLSGAAKLLGCSEADIEAVISGKAPKESLIGLTGTDHGFMSCGSTEKTGSVGANVQIHTYCPEGTQGLYVDPIVNPGGQGNLSPEVMLQRDTTVRTARIWVEGDTLHIESVVVGQNPQPLG